MEEIQKVFQRLDENGDRVISVEELRAVFQMHDTDKDGLISSEELGGLLKAFGAGIFESIEESIAEFSEFDTDNDGRISMDEFMAFWEVLKEEMGDAIKIYMGGEQTIPTEELDGALQALEMSDPNDGSISKEEFDEVHKEVKEMREAFDMYDKDGDGMISVEELGSVLQAYGMSNSAQEIARVLYRTDTDSDEHISMDEFVLFCKKEKDLREVFKTFDKDVDGKISVGELHETMKELGWDNIPVEDFDGILGNFDSDGDGYLLLEEFRTMNG